MLDDAPGEDVVHALGITPGHVAVLLHRAKVNLLGCMTEIGGTKTMRSKDLLEITDTNFDEVAMKAALPVLIDFTAAWCAPCRAIAPHIAAIARDYAGRLTVGTCDTDSTPSSPPAWTSGQCRRCCCSRAVRWSARSSAPCRGRRSKPWLDARWLAPHRYKHRSAWKHVLNGAGLRVGRIGRGKWLTH